jgi:hypothetical protein
MHLRCSQYLCRRTHTLTNRNKLKALFKDDYHLICCYSDVNKATTYRWFKEGIPTNNTALLLLDIAANDLKRPHKKPDDNR